MASTEEILVAVRDCWCQQLGDSVSTCCLTALRPVVPECCAGFGWVRLLGGYPSVGFPEPVQEPVNCRIDTWAIVVEIGVTRCAPQPCDILGPPCCAVELEAAVTTMDDLSRFRRVFSCCLPALLGPDGRPIVKSSEIVLGQFEVKQNGTCIDFTGQATIYVADACGC